jgi:OmpA-OmpF porin, OOP family
MKKHALATAMLCALASHGAFAQAYVGARFGATRVDIDCAGTISCDKNGTGSEVFGGYLLAPWVSVELGHTQWGSVKQHRMFVSGDVAFDLKTRGPTAGIAVFHQLGAQWQALARAGAAFQRVDLVRAAINNGEVEKYSERHTNPYLGLALGYQVTNTLSIGAALDFMHVKYSERFFGLDLYRNHSVIARRFGLGLMQQF